MKAFFYLPVLFVLATTVHVAFSQCSGSVQNLVASSTTLLFFTSPYYPNAYPNNQYCQWKISSANTNEKIFVSVDNVALEADYDYLYIYDGSSAGSSQIYGGSGGTIKSVSTGQEVYIVFTSDYSISYGGFQVDYLSIMDSTATCGGTLTATNTASQLSLINDIDPYIQSVTSCSFTITAAVATETILITLLYERSYDQRVDVYDGASTSASLLGRFTQGTVTGYGYVTSGSSAYLLYTSSSYYTGGFIVSYQSGSSLTTPSANSAIVAQSSQCQNQALLTAYSSMGILTSPNFPSPYSNNLYCATLISARDASMSVNVTLVAAGLPVCCDTLHVYDGTNTNYNLLISGDSWVGQTVTSTGSSVYVELITDVSGVDIGFEIEYQQVARQIPSCVSHLQLTYTVTMVTASTAPLNIQSTGYGTTGYNNDVTEYWLITKPNADDYLILEMKDIDVENALACQYDAVTIYDGPCLTNNVIAVDCGYTEKTYKDNTGTYVLVSFKTDSSVTKNGFSMDIYIGDADDDKEDDINIGIIIGVCVAGVFVIGTISAVLYFCCCLASKRGTKPFTPGDSTTPVVHVSQPPDSRVKPIPANVFLDQLKQQADARPEKKPKPKRKDLYNVSGRDDMSPHPPPFSVNPALQPFPGPSSDPAYPANFVRQYPPLPFPPRGQGHPAPIDSGASQGLRVPPSAPPSESMIPMPFSYMTPAQARLPASQS